MTEYEFPYYEKLPGGGQVFRELRVQADSRDEAIEKAVEQLNKSMGAHGWD